MVVPAPIEGQESGLQFRTILIVEDEVLIRMMVSEALRLRGFTVVEAAMAEEALIVLRSDTQVDLVLTDVRLPGTMDGVELAKWIREERPNLKIVIAASNVGLAPPGIVDATFEKPYDLDSVAQRVVELLTAGKHGN